MEQMPFYLRTPDAFPVSEEFPKGTKLIKFKDREGYFVDYHPDIVYDERDGEVLHLQVMLPMEEFTPWFTPVKKYPLVVYIPGSGWMRQDVHITLQRMMRVCERGYAVAVVQYRPSDVACFPAQIEDAKTAIRFMRKNSERYGIDVEKVALWGDSSGGHTALMAGFTDIGLFDNVTYGDYSCSVSCIVDWFGPTDIAMMTYYPGTMDHTAPDSPEGLLLGGCNILMNPELAQKVNVLNYLTPESPVPPVMIVHGDRDAIVPFNQSVRLYERMKELGKSVEFYKLQDAGHGNNGFESDGLLDLTVNFIAKHLS